MKLKDLHEDKDITPGGSREYATATEKAVYPKHGKSAAGSGVKPPPKGDISQITDVGSPGYVTDTITPSRVHTPKKPKVGRAQISEDTYAGFLVEHVSVCCEDGRCAECTEEGCGHECHANAKNEGRAIRRRQISKSGGGQYY